MNALIFALLMASLSIIPKDEYLQSCWAETTAIDRFVVIENGEERTITSNRIDNTQFHFSFQNIAATSIRLECRLCEEELSVKLWSPQEDAYTEWIYLRNKESISLSECFSKHAQRKGLSYLFNTTRQLIADFWASCIVGRTAPKRTPALRAIDPTDPKLVFLQVVPVDFFRPEDFQLTFQVIDGYSVQALYIKDYDNGNLLFHAGDTKVITRQGFDLSSVSQWVGKNVYSILQSSAPTPGLAEAGETVKEYSLVWNKLDPLLLGELRAGKRYQLFVKLSGDNSGHDPYSIVFRFLSEEEIRQLEQFARE